VVSMAHIVATCRGWWKEDGNDIPSELDQKTAFADQGARSWNETPGKGRQKRLLFKGRPIKSGLQKPRTLLSSQVVPFRGFQE
jgi:hypothetical protein